MAVAVQKFRQWFYVIPLLSLRPLEEGWQSTVEFFSRSAAIEKARLTAYEIAAAGDLRIIYHHQHIGFIHLVVESKGSRRTWNVDIVHVVHFSGKEFHELPDFEIARRVRFRFQPNPLPKGKPRLPSSYLTWEYVH